MENSKGKNGFISLFNLPHFFSCSFDSGFALDHLCSFVFFNNLIFLVKIRLLWVCLVMENLNERGKEIERKKKGRKQ